MVGGKEEQVNLLRGRSSRHVHAQMKAKSFRSLLSRPSLPSSLARSSSERGASALCRQLLHACVCGGSD